MKVYIYGLYDPRNGLLKYVGKAVDVDKRLRRHLKESRLRSYWHVPKCCWIRSLEALGLCPEVKVLEECNDRTWRERERFHIAFARHWGLEITNATDGGESSRYRGNPRNRIEPTRLLARLRRVYHQSIKRGRFVAGQRVFDYACRRSQVYSFDMDQADAATFVLERTAGHVNRLIQDEIVQRIECLERRSPQAA